MSSESEGDAEVWLPFRVERHSGAIVSIDGREADWDQPFYGDTLADLLRRGASGRAFLPQEADRGVVGPELIVGHCGRCASTLLARALEIGDRWAMFREPQPFNQLLNFLDPATAPGGLPATVALVASVSAQLAAVARRRGRSYAVKLSSPSTVALGLLADLWPAAHRVFVHRAAMPVILSQCAAPPDWLVRLEDDQIRALATLPEIDRIRRLVGIEWSPRPLVAGAAWLSAIEAAAAQCGRGGLRTIDYRSLTGAPAAVVEQVHDLVGRPTATTRAAVGRLANTDVKAADDLGRVNVDSPVMRGTVEIARAVSELAADALATVRDASL